MAKIAEELFEGGADEAAVTTSNSTATAVNGTVVFDTAFSVEGTRSARHGNGAASYTQFAPTASSNYYLRWYHRFSTVPAATNAFAGALSNSSTYRGFVDLLSDRRVGLRDSPGSTVNSTIQVTVGQWYRFEWLFSGTTQTLRIFTGSNLHGTTPDETLTNTLNTACSQVRMGSVGAGLANTWVDAFAADNTTWVGTAVNPPVTGTLAASLPALTSSLTGTVTWPTVTGAVAATVPTPTVAATGTVTWPVRTGQLAATLPGLSAGLAGDVAWPVRTGTLAAQLPVPTTTLTGTVAWPATTGQLAATLPTPAVSLTGDAPAAGSLAAALPGLTAIVTGDIGDARAGYLTATLTGPTVTLTGHVDVTGALAASLPEPSVTLAGDITTPAAVVTGALDVLLPGPEAHLVGTGPPVTAHHVLTVGPPRPGLVAGAPRPGLVAGQPRVPVTAGSPT